MTASRESYFLGIWEEVFCRNEMLNPLNPFFFVFDILIMRARSWGATWVWLLLILLDVFGLLIIRPRSWGHPECGTSANLLGSFLASSSGKKHSVSLKLFDLHWMVVQMPLMIVQIRQRSAKLFPSKVKKMFPLWNLVLFWYRQSSA